MGEIAELNREGDTKVIWDSEDPDQVAAARDMYNSLSKKGFHAFSVKKNGDQDERINKFDPELEKIIMVKPMAGG